MAPRDLVDLRSLNAALDLGMTDVQMDELFAGVRRRRGFRRAAGRALAGQRAARPSSRTPSGSTPETGLSIADLRDAVIEAAVIAVRPCDGPGPAHPASDDWRNRDRPPVSPRRHRLRLAGCSTASSPRRGATSMQTLAVAPKGRLWLGRLAPEIVVQNSRLGERSERLEPCEVGVRLRLVGGRRPARSGAPPAWSSGTSSTVATSPDADRWREVRADRGHRRAGDTHVPSASSTAAGRDDFAAALARRRRRRA